MSLALELDDTGIDAVFNFREDPQVLAVFKSEATLLLRGDVTKSRYNNCLRLVAVRIMYW